MPATQRQSTQPFPSSNAATQAVAAARAKQKAAFDACVGAMVKEVGARFTTALEKPKQGELEHVAAEKRFDAKISIPFEELFDGANESFAAARALFTNLDEDSLRTLMRTSLVQQISATLLAQEYDRIDVKEATVQQSTWRGGRSATIDVQSVAVSASFSDGT